MVCVSFLSDLMPTDVQCAKDAREVISACCVGMSIFHVLHISLCTSRTFHGLSQVN
jgi:hypothetical protein